MRAHSAAARRNEHDRIRVSGALLLARSARTIIDRRGLILFPPALRSEPIQVSSQGMAFIEQEGDDDGTSPRETPQQQQPMSLLSLPDELLLRIFDYLAGAAAILAQLACTAFVGLSPFTPGRPHNLIPRRDPQPLRRCIAPFSGDGRSEPVGRPARPQIGDVRGQFSLSLLREQEARSCAGIRDDPHPLAP